MKAKYIGHPDDRAGDTVPRRVGFGGKSFPRGHFVGLDGLKASEIKKLQGHPSFEVSEEPLTEAEKDAASAAGADAPPPGAEVAPSHVDALDKDQLVARLSALREANPEAGIEFSATWGEKRLRQALEDAQFAVGDEG